MKPFLILILLALSAVPAYSQARTAAQFQTSSFSQLDNGSPPLFSVRGCTNCAKTNGPCAAAGVGQPAGAQAMKLSTGWVCSAFGVSGGGDVTSITGTANQVIASASTGAITLSLPQSIAPSSSVTFGSLLTSGSIQSLDTVTGTHLFMSQFLRTNEIAAPSVSSAGSARLYADSTSHTLKTSVNGGAYSNLINGSTLTANAIPVAGSAAGISNSFFVQGGDSTNPYLQFGTATSAHIRLRDASGAFEILKGDGTPASASMLDLNATGSGTFSGTIQGTHLFTTTGFVRMGETAAPSVSSAGTGRLYADSTSHTFKASVNGGSFSNLTVNPSNLTSTALTTGNGANGVQTPCATCTMDGSGNVSTPGTVTATAFVASGSGAVMMTGSASNTDLAGQLTLSGGGTATFNFTGTYAIAPICVATKVGSAPTIVPWVSVTTTVLTVTGDAAATVNYMCIGRN